MNIKRNLLSAIAIAALSSSLSFALQAPGADPSNGSGWGTDSGDINNIQCTNSGTGIANPTGTYYWFAASDSQSNPSYTNGGIVSSANGHTQISAAAGTESNPSPVSGDLIAGNEIDKVLAATAYNVYAQACANGTNANDSSCTSWIKIKSSTISTKALPTAPIVGPAKSDVTTNSETLHTNSSSVPDPGNVQFWDIGLNNVQSSVVTVFSQTQHSYSSSLQAITIGPSGGYVFTLLPNNRYQSISQVEYFWSQPTAVPAQTENFTTTPVQPGPSTVSNITHCSVQISMENSNGSPANPSYTNYQACLPNGAGCQSHVTSGNTPTDTAVVNFSNLTAGTAYNNGTSQALNEDSAWNDSQTNSIPNFSTLSWGGTFVIQNVTATTADFVVSGITGAGSIATWQIFIGATAGPSGSGDPTGTHTLTGLTPDTAYNITIKLTEASGCTSTQPIGGVNFTTDAAIPQTFAMVAAGPTQINASWTANGNPGGINYDLYLCTDAKFTLNCSTIVVSGAVSTSLTGLTPETTYWGHVTAMTVGGGRNSASSNPASATTQNQAPSISNLTCTPSGTTANCTATASDNGGTANLRYEWNSTPAATSIVPNNQLNTPSTLITFPAAGTYNVSATVVDHQGAGLSASTTVQVVLGQSGSAVTISPSTTTIGQGGNQVFAASVTDQFGNPIPNPQVTWTIGSCGTVSPATGQSTTVTGTNVGTCTLFGAFPLATTGQATVTVSATAPAITNVTINPNPVTGKTGLLLVTASAFNNDPLKFTWSFVSPAAVTFSPNGTASVTSTATFTAAGTYTVQVTATDQTNSQSSNRNFTFTVNQTLTGLQACANGFAGCPNRITVQTSSNLSFTASGLDQFNMPMTATGVTWTEGGSSAGSGGSISLTAPGTIGQVVIVTAKSGNFSSTITLDLVSYDVSGAHAYPVPYKANRDGGIINFVQLGSDAKIRIYTPSGHKVFETEVISSNGTYQYNVKNSAGENLASGVYFFVVESPAGNHKGKLIVIQ